MIRIGRDHGKFRHEVGKLPMSELVKYRALYQLEYEEEKQRQAKIEGGS